MLRGIDNVAGVALLDDFTIAHHHDPVTDLRNHRQVMGNQNDRQVFGCVEFFQQSQNVRLHCYIQRRGRLIRQQQTGPAGHGRRNHRALLHAAGQLVRVVVRPLRGMVQFDLEQALNGGRACFRRPDAIVVNQGFADLLADLHQRVKVGCRILKNHRHLFATYRSQRGLIQPHQFAVFEADTAGNGCCWRQQAQDGAAGHRLA